MLLNYPGGKKTYLSYAWMLRNKAEIQMLRLANKKYKNKQKTFGKKNTRTYTNNS